MRQRRKATKDAEHPTRIGKTLVETKPQSSEPREDLLKELEVVAANVTGRVKRSKREENSRKIRDLLEALISDCQKSA